MDKEQTPQTEKTELKTTEKSKNTVEKAVIKAKPVKKSAAKKTTAAKAKKAVNSRSEHLTKLLALQEARKEGAKKSTVGAKKKTATTKKKTTKAKGKADSGKSVEALASNAPKRRRKRKPPYSKRELKELRTLLEDERDRLLRDLRQLDELADSGRETTHATFSSHQADAASDSASLESTFIQRRYEEERFAAVSEALIRLDNGSYGLCEMCADEPQGHCETCPFIPVERLRAKPFAKMCVQLRQVMEKKYKRY
jgi:RNA polymerase-binding transcription factor